MFHDLTDTMLNVGATYTSLMRAIEDAGYVIKHEDRDLLTDKDVLDVWEELKEGGVEDAVTVLETMYGYIFDQRE